MNPIGPLIIDLLGKTLMDDDIRRIHHPATGGVILFGRNFGERSQLIDLIAHIRQLRPELIISVDHEGGRVQRFKTDGFAHLPAMRDLGLLYAQDPAAGLRLAHEVGQVLAHELIAIGVDYSYTPVLDLDYGGSTVIGDRAFAAQPEAVIALARALLAGMKSAGMVGCGKHFPGHGFVVADSHVDMPVDERDFDALWAADIAPYCGLVNDLGAVMPAHVIYPASCAQPAGFSTHWLHLLRERIGFGGVIVTDDLSMVGAAGIYPNVTKRVHAALAAGCDMAMVCNRPHDLDAALDGLDETYIQRAHAQAAHLGGLRGNRAAFAASGDAYAQALVTVRPFLRGQSAVAWGGDPTEVMLG